MMKRYITIREIALFLFMMGTLIGYGQEAPPTNSASPGLIPDLTPPSPEAFAFTKYSSEVNEFSGKVSQSIPLYTYTAGQLKLPVSLNYNSSGVRVDDLPTWTGMNWMLSTGGVITRVVKNLADEYYDRLYLTDAQIDEYAAYDCAPNAHVFRQFYSNPQLDTQRDLFQFNFNGYSGSFYLNEDLLPVQTKNESPLKIEVLDILKIRKEFLITTPDGVKYYFGGTNAIENSSSSAHVTVVPTAFYLTKIEHPVNGTILLEYETITGSHFFKLNKVSYADFPVEFYYIGGCVNITDTYFSNKVQNQKTLKKIKSLNTSEEIIFNNTLYTNENFKRVLNSIEVKNNVTPTESILTKKIDFTYQSKTSNLNVDERFFLTKLEINKAFQNGSSPKKYEEFRFEYDTPFDLPARLSNAQDMLGFYNGKIFNQSMLPDEEHVNYLHCPGFANRSADYAYAKKGSLQKITYPTGGYTTFEYESNPAVKDKYTSSGTCAFRNVESLTQLYTSIPHLSTEIAMPDGFLELETIQNDLGLIAPMYATQKAVVNLNVSVLNYTNINSVNDRATFNVIRLGSPNQVIATKTLIIPSSHILSKSESIEVDFTLGEQYKIEVVIPSAASNATSLSANASVVYLSGMEQTDGAGLRVKRQKEFSSANILSDQKRYYYYPAEYIGNPTDVFSISDKIYPSFDIIVKNGGGSEITTATVFIAMYSNLTNQNMQALGGTDNDKVYEYVTTSYGGDLFENGGVQKEFNVFENQLIKRKFPIAGNDPLGFTTDSNPTLGGALLTSITFAMRNMASYEADNRFIVSGACRKERYFKKANNNLYITKDILHEYNNLETQQINNLVIKVPFTSTAQVECTGGLNVLPIASMYIGYYKTFSFNNYIHSSTTKEYFSPIAVTNKTYLDDLATDYDFSNVTTLSSTQDYEYGSLKGLPTKITTTTSEGVNKSVVNTYVDQAGSLSSTLTQPEINAYTALLTQNNVASPIQVQQYEGSSTLLSTQRTTYKQDATRVLPALIKTAKGTQNLEDRVAFEEYDAKGNPTLLSYTGGTKTKYLYNLNNQVIAKIENFTGTLDPNTTVISGDPCTFINQYPTSFVTVFTYDAVTHLLLETMDSNCRKTTYVYNAFHQLQQIKDHDGYVVKEFDTNYKPQ